jgi:hypothetical protein
MLIEDLKQHRKAEQEIARELSALFGVVYGTLSLAPREKVTSNAEYAAIREQDNGFDLWKLIYKVHTAGGTNESEVRKKNRISKEYMQCRKEASETLAQFHARFRDCIREMKATTQTVSGPSQAIRFIDSLDNSNFLRIQENGRERTSLGGGVPSDTGGSTGSSKQFCPTKHKLQTNPSQRKYCGGVVAFLNNNNSSLNFDYFFLVKN